MDTVISGAWTADTPDTTQGHAPASHAQRLTLEREAHKL